MRMVTVGLMLALAGAAARADPAPAPAHLPVPAAASRPPAPDPLLVFYPPAARAAALEGQAVIACGRDAHLALTACVLKSESPAGQGFGAAALALAAKSPQNPKVDLPAAAKEPAVDITVRFSQHPPGVTPDLTQMLHVEGKPEIVTSPTAAQVMGAYPARALDDQVSGEGVIDCMLGKQGLLMECHVYGEGPTGYGFGQAALDLAKDFVLKPRTVDGEPADGAMVRVPVFFSPTDPSAPLTLPTQPAPQ